MNCDAPAVKMKSSALAVPWSSKLRRASHVMGRLQPACLPGCPPRVTAQHCLIHEAPAPRRKRLGGGRWLRGAETRGKLHLPRTGDRCRCLRTAWSARGNVDR